MEELFRAVLDLQVDPNSGELVGDSVALVQFSHFEPVTGTVRSEGKLVSLREGVIYSHISDSLSPTALSPSKRYRVGFRTKETQRTLDIYREGRLVQTLDVTQKHAEVMTSPVLGRPRWSQDENWVVYIAQKKQAKTASFWNKVDTEGKGREFVYKENLGDGLENVSEPTLWLFHKDSNAVTEVICPEGTFPAQAKFSPSNSEIAFVAYQKPPYLQGIASNTNRPTSLYRLFLPEKTLLEVPISSRFMAVYHPVYSPNGNYIAYYAVPRTTTYCTSVVLCLYSLLDSTHRVLVDQVSERNGGFNGIYGYHRVLGKLTWVSDEEIAFESHLEGGCAVFVVDRSGLVREIELPVNRPYHAELLDVGFGKVLIKVSSITVYPQIYLAAPTSPLHYSVSSLFTPDLTPHTASETLVLRTLSATQHTPIQHNGVTSHLYWTQKDLPLCVVLHGGPHNTGWVFMHSERTMLLCAGFNLLIANYRGTSGFGLSVLEELTGHIGDMDVSDVLEALEAAKGLIGAKCVFATGLSHGGFLSAHLAATGRVQGAVVKSGVNSVLDMVYASDVPDWSPDTALGSALSHPLTEQEVVGMYRASPIARADSITCPVLILAGGKDACVPPFSSINLYKVLKARGLDVSMFWYPEDGHVLSTPATLFDSTMNEVLWLLNLANK